jgi:hypothetical protein
MRNLGLSFIAALALLFAFSVAAKETRPWHSLSDALPHLSKKQWPWHVAMICSNQFRT